jgi:peptidoglycan/LPS O-acetylase OafA/YrhL
MPRAEVSDNLELLRGVSILLVLIAHLDAVFLTPPEWHRAFLANFSPGLGVGIFLAISGYLVTYTLARRFARSGDATGEWAAFFVRRSSRTLPLAIFWALLTLAGTLWLNRVGHFGG